MLPGGAIYMDTPGIRELGIAEAAEAVSEIYEDVEELARYYRFDDQTEPDCAVRKAIAAGVMEKG